MCRLLRLTVLLARKLEGSMEGYKRGTRLPVKATDLVTEERLVPLLVVLVVVGVVALTYLARRKSRA